MVLSGGGEAKAVAGVGVEPLGDQGCWGMRGVLEWAHDLADRLKP